MTKRNRRRFAAYICFALSLVFITVLLFNSYGPHAFWRSLHDRWQADFGDGGLTVVLLFFIASIAFLIALVVYERIEAGRRLLIQFGGTDAGIPQSSGRRNLIAAGLSLALFCGTNQFMRVIVVGLTPQGGLLSGVYSTTIDSLTAILGNWGAYALISLLWAVPTFLPSLWLFHVLTARERRRTREMHCRKCDYILRGLSEPRCPECGEAI
jgi:hypothetical protein